MATSAPGYSSVRPNTCATVAEILKLNGYATAHVGKCHEVPVWETSPAGPFDRWPSPGNGFEYFYGFLGGETDQYYPTLHEGITRIEPWGTPEEGYHLTEDLTDKAIAWVRQQRALTPDKPFFMYFAPGATHAPHHVPKEWADKYRGRFDQGWDRLREETFARQKDLGVIPQDAELTRRHDEIPAWDDMPDELKPILARQMENYAGFLEHADHHVGRLVDALAELGALDDTLVYLIIGDNGASAEGTLQGTFNELISLNGMGVLETPEFMGAHLDDWGGPESAPHYAVGWAHAMCTPYQWTKQVASHRGGTRNGTIVHWPAGIQAKGELRHQFHHVIDVAPTLLEAARLPEPAQVNGITQRPMEGVSMRYSFDDGSSDWTQARDLSMEQPERLARLQRLFLIEATRYNVLPLDDRSFERVLPEVSGKPTLIQGDKQLPLPGMGALIEQHVVNWRNRSWSLTAQLQIPDNGANGVLLNLGGHGGGWSFYLKDSRPSFCHNLFGLQETIRAEEPVPPASTRSGWSSPTTAAGSARTAPSPTTSTATRSARAGSSRPSRSGSGTSTPTSAATPCHQ
jgi:arylsulfatase A-like enzyme